MNDIYNLKNLIISEPKVSEIDLILTKNSFKARNVLKQAYLTSVR